MTVTDRDRQRVYDAEEAALGGTQLDADVGWEAIATLAAAVVHHPWWSALDVPEPELRRTRSDARRSSADGATIRLSPHGRTPLTLAHELGHHLVAWLVPAERSRPEPSHGAAFRAAEIRTLALVGGSWAAEALADEWRRRSLPVAAWPWPEPPRIDGLAHPSAIALGPVALDG